MVGILPRRGAICKASRFAVLVQPQDLLHTPDAQTVAASQQPRVLAAPMVPKNHLVALAHLRLAGFAGARNVGPISAPVELDHALGLAHEAALHRYAVRLQNLHQAL